MDVYSSYVRRGQTRPQGVLGPHPLEEFCALYRRNARRVEELLAPGLGRFGYARATR